MPDAIIKPPRRTRLIDAINLALPACYATGIAKDVPLTRQSLMDEAAQATGLGDFGDSWFEEPFDVLLDALAREASLNRSGVFAARQQFLKVLKDRLWAQMWFDRHPEILARPMPRPVVIVGPMRSGTTRLHRLLSSDRRFNHLRNFETISPVPRPDFEEVLAGRKPDFRPILATRIMNVARLANPRTLSIHPTGPMEPEEELGLLVNSMYGMKHDAQWQVPIYGRWCEQADATPAYQQMVRLLQLIGWSQGESSLKPWILKTPQHMLDLPALLEVLPDARIIFTHRDPRALVGSAASLAWNQTIIYSDDVGADEIGREWLRKTSLAVERMQADRKIIPPDRAIDIQYEDMEHDWRGTMARIYRFLDLDMEPAVPGMTAYLDQTAALKRKPHRYSLAEFGLNGDHVLAEFSGYIRAFDVPLQNGGRAKLERRVGQS